MTIVSYATTPDDFRKEVVGELRRVAQRAKSEKVATKREERSNNGFAIRIEQLANMFEGVVFTDKITVQQQQGGTWGVFEGGGFRQAFHTEAEANTFAYDLRRSAQ